MIYSKPLDNASTHIHPFVSLAKRTIDILSAVFGILLTMLLLPFIALAIRIDSKGPVFYSQQRIGREHSNHTAIFNIYKFRTMHLSTNQSVECCWAAQNDPRITRVGKFLRKSRIDELPQFINVLRGDMSLIGPRPEQPGLIDSLEKSIPFYRERVFNVAPGITGLAQIEQGYDKNIEDARAKIAYDHTYALTLAHPLQWLRLEAYIILQTILVVIKGSGH